MSTDAYIELVYRNLKGELSPEEFQAFNKTTAENAELASLRLEIEDAWDISGGDQDIVKPEETEKLIGTIIADKKSASIFSLRNVMTAIAAMFVFALCSIWLLRDQSKVYTKEGLYTLADNSTVELRKGSRLEVNYFAENVRNVSLEGEAYFEIVEDSKRPFTVLMANSKIEVLGTSFLVKEASGFVFVDLKEGKVKFSGTRNPLESLTMTKGMQASYSLDNGVVEVNYPNLSAWKNGMYQYQDQTLGVIVDELSILFFTNIRVLDDQLLDCRISAILTAESLDDILKQLAGQLEMYAKKEGQGWSLTGGKCR